MEASSKPILCLLLLCALLALAAGADLLVEDRESNVLQFFSEALRDADVREHVLAGGRTYNIAGGVVRENGAVVRGRGALLPLALAYKKALARRTPLLPLAGTDPDALLNAVQELERTQALLAQTQSDPGGVPLIRSLYPTGSLRVLAELERARIAFLETGTIQEAWRYDLAVRTALWQLRADLAAFRRAFSRAVPSGVGEYATPSTSVTRANVLEALDALLAGLNDIETVLGERLSCTRGGIASCDLNDLSLPRLEEQKNVVPEEAIARAREIRSLFGQAGTLEKPDDNLIVVLAKSACAPDNPIFSVYTRQFGNFAGYTNLLWLGDIRFVLSEKHPDIPFFSYFSDHGVRYVPVPLNHYSCAELGKDWGRVFGVLDARKFARALPISKFAGEAATDSLKKLERALLSSDVVHERDAVEYVALAQELDEELPEDSANKIAALSLKLRNGSAGLDLFIREMAIVERTNIELLESSGPPADMTIPYLFFVRSAFPSLFISGEIVTTELFARNEIPPAEQPYTFYSSLRNDPQERKRLVRDMLLYHRAFNEYLE